MTISSGSTTFPLDLDIFLPCESRAHPEIMACSHGTLPVWNSPFTTVLKSQKVMMSWACGLRLMGYIFSKKPCSSFQPRAIIGVREDVAQVSRMSTSGTESREPHFGHAPSGLSTSGSTGSCSSLAMRGSSHAAQYHTGNGTPE